MKNQFAILIGLVLIMSMIQSIEAKSRQKRFKVKSVQFIGNTSFTEKRLYQVSFEEKNHQYEFQ